MSRVRGRSFKITKNQAKGYGYARPGAYRRNPGVTTIAAINGRGSYAGSRSARSVMSKLKRNARLPAARRAVTSAQKRAFKAKLSANRGRRFGRPSSFARNRSTSSAQSASSKRNIRKAQSARRAWGQKLPRGKRVRVGRASYGRKPKARRLKAGVYVANRRKKAGKKTMARRRRKGASGASKKRRRSSKRRRRKTSSLKTAAPKRRRRRRKAKKASAGKRRSRRRGSARRRRRSKAAAPHRRRRRSRKAGAPRRRRRRSKAAAPRRRRRRSRKAGAPRRRRRRSKAAAPRRRRRSMKANGRRRRRSSRRRSMKSNRRRRSHRRNRKSSGRRRHRRNGRRLFRRNGAGDYIKMGAVLLAGFGLHRLVTNIIDRQVLPRLLPAPAAPAATSGFDLSGLRGLLTSVGVGVVAGWGASKAIKNAETKKLVIGGVVVSTLHGVVMSLLKAFVPQGADMLAGPEDGTAARLSAMYGLGAGASIMPRYAPINGLGEYFREPMNGLGEYFREPMNGLGEYIAATNGLGTYENNGDLYQAAAGFGSHDYNGNHIDPSGDLDRQLTIAEAAAGVGAVSPFEAAAGIGPMQAAAGFGAVDTVPSADTWIPGSADPQLWAGVKAVSQGQSATELTPAGVLQTDGGQGIFG